MTSTADPQVGGALAPFGSRDFTLLFTGQITSLIGDSLLVVGLPLLLLPRGGPSSLADALAAYGVARLAGLPVGGWLGDRLSRRLVMLVSDAVRGALTVLLAVVATSSHVSTMSVALAVGLLGLAEGVFLPPSFSILPSTVPEEMLVRANSLSTGAQNLAMLIGPGLGGLAVAAVSPALCFALDAVTFLVSAVTLASMRPASTGSPSDRTRGKGELLTFLRTNRLLPVLVGITALSNLAYFGMLEVALPSLTVDSLHAGAFGFGLALATFGCGSVIGSQLASRLDSRHRPGQWAIGLGVTQGLLFCAVSGVGLVSAMVLLALAGTTNGVLNVFYLSRLQQRIPGALLSRAMTLVIMSVFAIHPLSVVLAGRLTTTSGPAGVFLIAGLAIAVAFALSAFTRTYREL